VPRFVVEYGLVTNGSRAIKDLILKAVYTFVSVMFIVLSSEKVCFPGIGSFRIYRRNPGTLHHIH
jgi:hypothetical protein